MVGTVRNPSLNQREVKWFHTRSATAPSGQGKGGTIPKPSLFDIDGHRLVWRGCLNNYVMNDPARSAASNSTATVLIMGSIPPLHRGYVLSLLKNNDPISISITPESLDMKGRWERMYYLLFVVSIMSLSMCCFSISNYIYLHHYYQTLPGIVTTSKRSWNCPKETRLQ